MTDLQNEKIISLEAKVEQLTQELEIKDRQLDKIEQTLKKQEKLNFVEHSSADIFHDIMNYIDSGYRRIDSSSSLCQLLINIYDRGFIDFDEEFYEELYGKKIEIDKIFLRFEKSLDSLKSNFQQILKITENIRTYLKSENERVEPDFKSDLVEININELVSDCLDIGCQSGEAKKLKKGEEKIQLKLEKDYDSNIEKLFLPASNIERILINLIDNSYYAVYEKSQKEDYTPTISTKTELIDDKIKITIRDNGIGFPQNMYKEEFFKPFYSTKPSDEGTGIGLNIVVKLVRQIGGEIILSSEENQYSQFVLSIPINKDN